MIRKSVILIFPFLFCWPWTVLNAQQDKMRFECSRWDFSHLPDTAGKQIHTFRFVNVGTSPIVINRVISTCACAVSSFSKQPVKAGESGFVTVTFDPQKQMNRVSKQLRVVYNGGKSVHTLHICGFVDISPDQEIDFPYELAPGVFADQWMLSYRNLQHNAEPVTMEVKLWNRLSRPARLSYRLKGGNVCISRVEIPEVIPAQSIAVLCVTAVAPNGFYGSFCDKIEIQANAKQLQTLEVYGTVIDDLRGMSMLTGPKLFFSPRSFQLENIRKGEVRKQKARLVNEGKKPLNIRKIECPEGIVADWGGKSVLKPGEAIDILFLVKILQNKEGNATVKIVTNDPRKPIYPVSFNWTSH